MTVDKNEEFKHIVAVTREELQRKKIMDARPSEHPRNIIVRNRYYRRKFVQPLQNAGQNPF